MKQAARLLILQAVIALIFVGRVFAGDVSEKSFHHHIHNFSSNNEFLPRHALEMGYKLLSGKEQENSEYAALGTIKNHNAGVTPMRIDAERKRVSYFSRYGNSSRTSLLRPDRQVGKWYPMDEKDIELLKYCGCARKSTENFSFANLSVNTLKDTFYTVWQDAAEMNIFMNWQNRAVTDNMIRKALEGLESAEFDAIFFDEVGRDLAANCYNKDTGKGYFTDWKDGQKEFLKGVIEGIKQKGARQKKRYYIFANIWRAFNKEVLKWYKEGTVRFDHYYLESGKDLEVNGIDPETGRPAFVSAAGFLPADMVSVDALYGWYGSKISGKYREGKEEYFLQHLQAAGIAGRQGSWFGWYGEDNINKFSDSKESVYTNDLQLLRVIPNWDNLCDIALSRRNCDSQTLEYKSPNSFASKDMIYSRHYETGELFAVFKTLYGKVALNSTENIKDARFADKYFSATEEDALTCLRVEADKITLLCPERLSAGIRIKLK